jgi:hypothetical protein
MQSSKGPTSLFLSVAEDLNAWRLTRGIPVRLLLPDILKIVGRFAMIAMPSVTVPAHHNLFIVEHLEEVGGIWWLRSINGVFKPDLGS